MTEAKEKNNQQSRQFGQLNLFEATKASTAQEKEKSNKSPLAFRARPKDLANFFGHEDLFKKFPFLLKENFPGIIFWGPPGCGKTTLARILAENSKKEIFHFNAVLGGVNDLKKIIASALELKKLYGKDSCIFIDEIHRFNKGQQDALLPYIEKSDFTLIGATTKVPYQSINQALLSRLQVIELKKLNEENINKILKNAIQKIGLGISVESNETKEIITLITSYTDGDARKALNLLEIVVDTLNSGIKFNFEMIKNLVLNHSKNYDRNENMHFDVISAFIKSLRGSDPDAALLWLAVMLNGGEDPLFIARRLVVFASEDIGNADINALPLAVAALNAVNQVGMPEARINLAHAAIYLASTVKSNATIVAIDKALAFVSESKNISVPEYLKNKNASPRKYKYPHDYPKHFIREDYRGQKIPKFYEPTEMGHEKRLKERLHDLWGN